VPLSCIEELYRIFPWSESLNSPIFSKRLEGNMKLMRDVLCHRFIHEVLKNRNIVRVVDVEPYVLKSREQ